jgi:hypothetical protein
MIKVRAWLFMLVILTSCTHLTDAPTERQRLTRSFLLGDEAFTETVSMHEFAIPGIATRPSNLFSGSLRLIATHRSGRFEPVSDIWDRLSEIGEPVRHLPEFDFQFFQRGYDIVPLQRGVIRREHPYWEVILQPGKAWNEAGDGGWTRASVPFALQERSANCTHNGVLMWLFKDSGEVSRVAYQISSETCGYFKFDMWGVVAAEYRRQDLDEQAAAHFKRLDKHRNSRLPVRPLVALAVDFPGVDPLSLGVEDGIPADDMTVLGMVVDGVHYRSNCNTRQGPHPYCDSLSLPSYSTAKSIFASVAVMRLEKLYPGISQATIASLVDECNSKEWRDVTIENALDMTTGNFRSTNPGVDEDSAPHEQFVFSDKHKNKLDFACSYFERNAKPGSQFVYHTSDTYLVGVALTAFLGQKNPGADLYETVLVEPLWRSLGLSPLMDDSKRTYDRAAQPFAGYGLTYEVDDIVRIAAWLNEKEGMLGEHAMIDGEMLEALLQRTESDPGLEAGSADLRYNNGFWAFNAGPSIGCAKPAWVPFMSGVSGITVAMFPNGIIYYYYSDSYVFRWQSAREMAHKIRRLC